MGMLPQLSSAPSEQLRHLYLDSVCVWPPALRLALDTFGPGRVLFGSDEPFWHADRGIETLEALELDSEALALVAHGNADRLFGPAP
jgi:aminocarboxymuconate-semialdehyde decarboxylase